MLFEPKTPEKKKQAPRASLADGAADGIGLLMMSGGATPAAEGVGEAAVEGIGAIAEGVGGVAVEGVGAVAECVGEAAAEGIGAIIGGFFDILSG